MEAAGCATRLGVYSCREAKAKGKSPQECCAAGFTLEEGKAAGYGTYREECWQHGTRGGRYGEQVTRW